MFLENIELLHDLSFISILIRILLALLLGGALGVEREKKQRPAGFRTYIIVCLGATLAAITSIYIYDWFGGGDPARIPAQVISGIGFLGAGTILVSRNNSHIKGLTTAAGLWCAATIGIAVGMGFYTGAILCTAAIMFSLRILPHAERFFAANNQYITLYIEYDTPKAMREIIQHLKSQSMKLNEFDIMKSKDGETFIATVTIKMPSVSASNDLLEYIGSIEGIIFAEELYM